MTSLPRSFPASYDLHPHTFWSYDALAEPELYFHQARKLGVKCLAVTEHHNMDSVPDLEALAGQYPDFRVIRAAKLTVTTSIGPVDLLCYNLTREPKDRLAQILQEYRAGRMGVHAPMPVCPPPGQKFLAGRVFGTSGLIVSFRELLSFGFGPPFGLPATAIDFIRRPSVFIQ